MNKPLGNGQVHKALYQFNAKQNGFDRKDERKMLDGKPNCPTCNLYYAYIVKVDSVPKAKLSCGLIQPSLCGSYKKAKEMKLMGKNVFLKI